MKLIGPDVSGVLVTKIHQPLRRPSDGSNVTYSAEKDAAFLGWLWSLPCMVINRYQPDLWFEHPATIDFWRGRLQPFGLETAEPDEVHPNLGERISTQPRYLASVVGDRVIWDEGAPEQIQSAGNALAQFTKSLRLHYLEFQLEVSGGGPRVSDVELFPNYTKFCVSSRQEITNELVALLTSAQNDAPVRTASDSWF